MLSIGFEDPIPDHRNQGPAFYTSDFQGILEAFKAVEFAFRKRTTLNLFRNTLVEQKEASCTCPILFPRISNP
jgi:hypothetical protein